MKKNITKTFSEIIILFSLILLLCVVVIFLSNVITSFLNYPDYILVGIISLILFYMFMNKNEVKRLAGKK
jgi:ACR3 family arsenite efflux pump ArsB